MQQKLYVLAALGVVMNGQAIKTQSPAQYRLYEQINLQANDDDEDDEPMAELNVDFNKMEKAMTNTHVDLIVSDFDHAPSQSHHHSDKHHKHHHNQEKENVDIQSKVSVNDDSSDFDTKVLEAYTNRNTGANSDKAAIEDAVFENKRKANEAKEDQISQKMASSEQKITHEQVAEEPAPAKKEHKHHHKKAAEAAKPAPAQAAPAQAAPAQAAPAQAAPAEAAPAQAAPAAPAQAAGSAAPEVDAANEEVKAAKAELAAALQKNNKAKTETADIDDAETRAMKKIEAVGAAMEKKLEANVEEAPAATQAPAAVPIGQKMKEAQTGQGVAANAGIAGALQKMKQNGGAAGAAQPQAQASEVKKTGMTTSDIVNEIVGDMKEEGLDSTVKAPVQKLNQIKERSFHSMPVEEDGAGEDEMLSTNERIMKQVQFKQEQAFKKTPEYKNQQALIEQQKKQREVNELQQQKIDQQKESIKSVAQTEERGPIVNAQNGKLLWPSSYQKEPELEDWDTKYDFEM